MLKIGELARDTGLAPSKIRFYEAEGLIGAIDRTPGGYRQYSNRTKQILELIVLGQQAGFSLGEIRTLLPQVGKSEVGHEKLLAGLRKKLTEVEALQRKLVETRAGLTLVIERIEKTPPGSDCFENAEGVLEHIRSTAISR